MENYILIQGNNFETSRKEIRENRQEADKKQVFSSSAKNVERKPLDSSSKHTRTKDKKIIFLSNNGELNRKVLEKEPIDILLLNQSQRKDKLKQRDSGFNHVLARIAKKNNITIGINLDEIINSREKNKSEILARVEQNIKLCNKNRLKMKFISLNKNKRDIYDLRALGLVLGMPTWMTGHL